MLEQLQELAEQKVDLAVFPEAFVSGYCARSKAEADRLALHRQPMAELANEATRFGTAVIFGFIERDGQALFNSACLGLPGEEPKFYRKTHLPKLGVDQFVTPGDELPVFETPWGVLGTLICFDMRYPEAARTLTLKGADLLVIPTNWPRGAEVSANSIAITRAAENHVFVATCNRVGEENGFAFIGQSKIISPNGEVLQAADDQETVLVAELDLQAARQKRRVIIRDLYETEILAVRRPDLYALGV